VLGSQYGGSSRPTRGSPTGEPLTHASGVVLALPHVHRLSSGGGGILIGVEGNVDRRVAETLLGLFEHQTVSVGWMLRRTCASDRSGERSDQRGRRSCPGGVDSPDGVGAHRVG
jgi:hypothetical protein